MGQTRRIDTIIGERTHLRGEFHFGGAVRVDGCLVGRVNEAELLVIGPPGRLDATVYAQELEVAGEVRGDVFVTGQVRILATGRLYGTACCEKLVVKEGGVFIGRSQILTEKADSSTEGAAEWNV